MRIIESVFEMQQTAAAWRWEGKRFALVPTMGYLHEGHLCLARAVRERADVVVLSVFVNPVQFGPAEDFERYPRDLEHDVELAEGAGVDVVFAPAVSGMYPEGYQTYVEVTSVTRPLCGRNRPVHFRGVTTVVTKLFNIVKPHAAIFGEKDYQQLVTVRRMAGDLNMDIEILGLPTVREPDGLAMSSRNKYLSADQRRRALRLSASLEKAQALLDSGERQSGRVLAEVRATLGESEDMEIDYAELRDPETLEEVFEVQGPVLLALAVRFGATRLIDNRVLKLRS